MTIELEKEIKTHLELLDLGFQLAAFIASYRTSNDRSCNSTSSPKSLFGRNKDIWHILVSQKMNN